VTGTIFYIDGLNFYYGAVKRTPNKWIDFEKVARLLVPGDKIERINYFNAIVKPSFPGDRAHERQNAYLRAVEANPLIVVHRGHFRSDIKWRGLADHRHPVRDLLSPALRPHFVADRMYRSSVKKRSKPYSSARVVINEEKCSDVNLATHLVYDALKGNCSKAIVITNDGDLVEPIKIAVAEGVEVGIVNPHQCAPNRKLLVAASFPVPFRREAMAKCQLPPTVVAKSGRQIHKPKEWA